jgi:hypothetical protein
MRVNSSSLYIPFSFSVNIDANIQHKENQRDLLTVPLFFNLFNNDRGFLQDFETIKNTWY